MIVTTSTTGLVGCGVVGQGSFTWYPLKVESTQSLLTFAGERVGHLTIDLPRNPPRGRLRKSSTFMVQGILMV